MTNSEAIAVFLDKDTSLSTSNCNGEAYKLLSPMKECAIKALEENNKLKAENEQLKSRNCQSCVNKGKCAIFDNFNIDYCSDWEKGGNNGNGYYGTGYEIKVSGRVHEVSKEGKTADYEK